MQIKEAIEFLSRYLDNEYYTNKCNKAHQIAISALEKQIPKKPKDYPLSDGQCPTCNAVFDYDWKPKSKFCQNCGQRLDWGDEDA
jgi:rRNA maturation endonuclease Nob1